MGHPSPKKAEDVFLFQLCSDLRALKIKGKVQQGQEKTRKRMHHSGLSILREISLVQREMVIHKSTNISMYCGGQCSEGDVA